MECTLCKKTIENYNSAFNHLKIDESLEVEICPNCVDKFIKWQQGVYADLFPTKMAKKRVKK